MTKNRFIKENEIVEGYFYVKALDIIEENSIYYLEFLLTEKNNGDFIGRLYTEYNEDLAKIVRAHTVQAHTVLKIQGFGAKKNYKYFVNITDIADAGDLHQSDLLSDVSIERLNIKGIKGEVFLSSNKDTIEFIMSELDNSQTLYISTYNISKSFIYSLKKFFSGKEVVLITNVPDKNIDDYFDMLNPTNFWSGFKCFFNMDNHAKLFILDHIGYVGSANASKSSKIECGVIIREKIYLEKLLEIFNHGLIKHSTEYLESKDVEIIKARNILNQYSENLKKLCNEDLKMEIYEELPKFEMNAAYTLNINEKTLNDCFGNIRQEIDNLEQELLRLQEIVFLSTRKGTLKESLKENNVFHKMNRIRQLIRRKGTIFDKLHYYRETNFFKLAEEENKELLAIDHEKAYDLINDREYELQQNAECDVYWKYSELEIKLLSLLKNTLDEL